MSSTNKVIRTKVCHNVHADATDILNNGWHKGYRLENSETVAFYFKKNWYASAGGEKVKGPFKDKETAIRVEYKK